MIAPKRYPLGFATQGEGTDLTVGPAAEGAAMAIQVYKLGAWRSASEHWVQELDPVLRFYAVGILLSGENRMRLIFPDGSVAYSFTVLWQGLKVTPLTGFN